MRDAGLVDQDMKLLVTGSLGLVGSESVRFFEEKGWEVVGVDNNMRSQLFGVEVGEQIAIDIDIRDAEKIDWLFSHNHFDAIIHAAAQPSHDWAKKNPIMDFDINARATLLLLEATRKYCPKAIFVYVSTDKVYGENMKDTLATESLGLDFAGKRSLFGCSKAAADMYVQEYRNYFGMTTVCFRPGCITGKNHKGAEEHGFLSYVAKCVREGKPYTIYNNAVRDQIHVYDLVNAFWHYIQDPQGDVYNIGGGPDRAIDVRTAIQECEAEIGNAIEIKYGEKRLGDRDYDVHDMTKFRLAYPNWTWEYSLAGIIKDVCST